MKFINPFKPKTKLDFTLLQKFGLVLAILLLGITNPSIAQSTKEFKTSTDTLVVYSDVPGLAPSDKYTIRVRSAATNNEWVQCFANYTYNRGLELPTTPSNDGNIYGVQNYIPWCSGWSQTYANIEMNENSTVEVEIIKIGSALLDGVAVIEKSAVHPSHKVFDKRDENGKVYFKLNKPCQVVIDINGQMDDHNFAITGLAQIGPVHALTFFANPVIQKPLTTGVGIRSVTAGTTPDTTTNFSTMVFGPGVHHIGASFKIYAKKSYYIPGDAILYGSLTNSNTPVNGRTNGDGISIYGYGTLCGFHIPHHSYKFDNPGNPSYPNYNGGSPVGITIENGVDLSLKGITIADPGNSVASLWTAGVDNSKVQWVKGISWRANGDGINGKFLMSDCFLRTSDDCSILEGVRKRCTYWKDSQGNIIRLRNYYSSGTIATMEDCDFIYNRRRPGSSGTVFRMHNGPSWQYQKQIPVNVTVRNIRFHDRKANMPIFELNCTDTYGGPVSYNGLTFENISFYVPIITTKSKILGTAATPWNEGLIFSNVTFNHDNGQPPVLLTKDNFNTYFTTNEYVKNIWFRMPQNFSITTNANSTEGSITVSPVQTTYIENSVAILTALAQPGYDFTGWSGDTIATSNPLLLKMNGNKTVTANFVYVGKKTLTLTAAANGSVANSPTGTSHSFNSKVQIIGKPAIGYQFDGWSGDFTSNSIVDSVLLNSDKTVTANFVKTNSFAVNYGGDQHISADGTVYAQGQGNFTRNNKISGTDDPILYQSERFGKTFSLDYPVENGDYTVTLKFADLTASVIGKRVFNVAIEGTPVLTNFDIFAEVGANKALDKTFQVTVTGDTLSIDFTTIADNAKISAVKITKGIPVSLTKSIGGKVSGGGGFPAGQSVTVTATTVPGFYFENWKDKAGAGAVVSTDSIYTFTLVNPVDLQANFGKYINITFLNTFGGKVTGGGNFKSGQSVKVTAIPDAGYKFLNWTDKGVFKSGYNPYTFTATTSMELQANFVDDDTNLSNIKGVSKFNIYPNPATDKLFFNSADKLINKIQMVDLTGKIVFSVNVQLQNGSIDLSGIASGLYVVKLYTAGAMYSTKVLKE